MTQKSTLSYLWLTQIFITHTIIQPERVQVAQLSLTNPSDALHHHNHHNRQYFKTVTWS